jgi:hypothetical protein
MDTWLASTFLSCKYCYYEHGCINIKLRVGGVAQVVEQLPNRCKAQNSSHSTKINKSTNKTLNWAQWFTPVNLATQETEIRRISIQSQPRQIVPETLTQKNPSQKRAGGVASFVVSGSNPSTAKIDC